MNTKKIGTVFTSKFVGTGPSSYKKIIYRAAVLQRLRNTGLRQRTINYARSVAQSAMAVRQNEYLPTRSKSDK